MFNLDTIRLIRKTFKRFLSLTLIVMIGAGFAMGMTSTPLILRNSVDAYYDEMNFQDVQIYSSYGFCVEDYETVKGLDGVKDVFPSRTFDCNMTLNGDEEYVVRVGEMTRRVNDYVLMEGRLPQKNDECIINYEQSFASFAIGDVITLDYGKEDIHDYLKNDTFTIVGCMKTPEYMSRINGSSNFNNQGLDTILFVPNANFIADYYTTMYVTLIEPQRLTSYTGTYNRSVSSLIDELENGTYAQQNYRRDILLKEAQEELDKQTQLFNELKTEGQKELDDAAAQLQEAGVMIAVYEAEMATMDGVIASLQASIDQDLPLISDIYNNTVEMENGIMDLMEEFGLEGDISYGSAIMDYAFITYDQLISEYGAMRSQLNGARTAYEDGMREYQEGLASFNKQIADGELELRLAQQEIDELPKASWTFLDRNRQYSAALFKTCIAQMNAIGTYLPIMFFLVAALVCLTTMKRLVDEQRGQIGIFVALGFSDAQIIMKYVVYALIASLFGGIIGVSLGELLFPTVIYNTWRLMYEFPDMRLSYPLPNMILSILSFTVLMCGLTAYVVKGTLKEVPAALMRPKAPKQSKEIFLEKIPFIWEKMSFTSKITARNIFRYRSRFLMIIVGIAGCTGLLVLGYGIKDSVSDVLDIQYGQIFQYNYEVYLEDSEHLAEDLRLLDRDPNIEFTAPYMNFTTRAYMEDDDETAIMFVVSPANASLLLGLRETDRKTPLKLTNEGIVVSERFAQLHDLKKGDYITIESPQGLKAEVKIANICEMYFQHYIFITDAVYENLFELEPEDNVIAINTTDKASLMADCNSLEGFSSLFDFDSQRDDFANIIEALNLIIAVIILVAGSLAFVVLINLTQVNISEREREIATLKVLGFNSREIDMYIFKETLLLSLLGGLVGLPLGVLEHHLIMGSLSQENIMFGLNIYPLSFITSFLITIVFTLIVMVLMHKPLNDVDMIESLKSVE